MDVLNTLDNFWEWPDNIHCDEFELFAAWEELHDAPKPILWIILGSICAFLHKIVDIRSYMGTTNGLSEGVAHRDCVV